MLYFFNFVNGPLQGTLDGETKKKVNPERCPRALFWFRWGAALDLDHRRVPAQIVFYSAGSCSTASAPGRRGDRHAAGPVLAPFL
jgi:hypothetical protein